MTTKSRLGEWFRLGCSILPNAARFWIRIERLAGWSEARIREGLEGDYHNVTRADLRSAQILILIRSPGFIATSKNESTRSSNLSCEQVWNLNLNRYSGTQLLKYEIAGHYQPHQDTGVDLEGRYFSIVCYLNDDFEGGRTLFPPLHHAVVPRAGLAAIFPSTYLHGSEPVVSGKKFVLVSWIEGRVPVKWI